jgi:hypothetical protein
MRLVPFYLFLTVALNGQAVPQDSTIELKSTLERINLETAHKPISLIIAVRTNEAAVKVLAAIRQMGPMLAPLVAGGRGEIAVLSYGDRIRTIQPFTSDAAAVANAIAGLQASGTSFGLIDTIEEGISELESRPADRRRVLLLIGETRDSRGHSRTADVVDRAQRSNVLIYAVQATQN